MLGFVLGMKVPGMVLAFVIVTLLLNCNYFILINFKTDWENLHHIDEHGGEVSDQDDTKLEVGNVSGNELATGENN